MLQRGSRAVFICWRLLPFAELVLPSYAMVQVQSSTNFVFKFTVFPQYFSSTASPHFSSNPELSNSATMPNIHGLHGNSRDRDSSDSEDEANRDASNRYVGGIGAQGGGRCVPSAT